MTDEKLFQYLISRVQVRETSTLTVAAIASSASIILLGLYFSPGLGGELAQYRNIIFWAGILSPIIGFSYFEIIFATNQSWDYDNINKMIRKESKRPKDELDEIIFGKNRALTIFKPALWRVLLSIPIISWLSLVINPGLFLLLIIMSGLAISLLICRIESIKDKIINEKFKKYEEDYLKRLGFG